MDNKVFSSMKFNPVEIISAPVLWRQNYYPLIQIIPRSVPQIRPATCVYYDGWMKYIFRSDKEKHTWLWKKLSYSHTLTPEGWRWKKVNFIIRTVEFINYSRSSAVKSLHNSVIVYNAEMGKLVQNYRIKFTNKHASSFGTWWEMCGEDRGNRLIEN